MGRWNDVFNEALKLTLLLLQVSSLEIEISDLRSALRKGVIAARGDVSQMTGDELREEIRRL
eukprot:6205040-Pleurochrysis_carterae.AAC.2